MSDDDGNCPISSLNVWERQVVLTERSRAGCVGWYRNPPRQSIDSLGVPYRDGAGNWRSMHPDFVFFSEVGGVVRASIVDPHGHHLEDSLVKLRGLATFAQEFEDSFHRVEAVSQVGNTMKVLDLTRPEVRDAIVSGHASPAELYESDLAQIYN